jgi:hypothetical protein
MVTIEFIADFAGRKTGYVWEDVDSMLASQLVHEEKVAKYVKETEPKQTKSKK